MKVFVSWSGDTSRRAGEAISKWLPSVLQYVRPYFTPNDIEKGARWNSDIAKELEACEVGVFCLTPEALGSNWVFFEAGSLAKQLDKSRVCPILLGVDPNDLPGPLSQFQSTNFSKTDVHKLLRTINKAAGDAGLAPDVLDNVFDKWWPELNTELKQILEDTREREDEAKRPDREVLDEILELARLTARQRVSHVATIPVAPIRELIMFYIDAVSETGRRGKEEEVMSALRGMQPAVDYLARRSRLERHNPELTELLENLSFEVAELPF